MTSHPSAINLLLHNHHLLHHHLPRNRHHHHRIHRRHRRNTLCLVSMYDQYSIVREGVLTTCSTSAAKGSATDLRSWLVYFSVLVRNKIV